MLIQNNRSAIRNLVSGDYPPDLLDPGIPFFIVSWIACTFVSELSVCGPECESARGHLSVAIWSCARDYVETGLLGVVEESLDVVGACVEVESVFGGTVVVPEEVD